MKYVIGNWKANKTLSESLQWTDIFITELHKNRTLNKKIEQEISVVICPPFPHLHPLKQKLEGFGNIFLGAQDISSVEKGTYTGETTALNLQGLIQFAIIGHSERKKNFYENEQMISLKLQLANKYGIRPFYCINNLDDIIPSSIQFICWEPPESISHGDGKGNFKPLSDILNFKKQLNVPNMHFIYGGSVNENNIKEYTKSDEIEGFIIGGASLDPYRFLHIIENF